MELTQPADWLEKPHTGYVVNAPFSDENVAKLRELIDELENEFGTAVFCMPENSLHITLLDWIAPLIDYNSQNKDDIFREIQTSYDHAMSEATSSEMPTAVTFDEIHISPSTIYVTGSDTGQFKKIRDSFLANVTLLPGTKLPPTIIHSSLVRFRESLPMDRVRDMLSSKAIHFTQEIDVFRLVRTTREPMLEFEVLKEYHLKEKE